jgi:hypothetical protein
MKRSLLAFLSVALLIAAPIPAVAGKRAQFEFRVSLDKSTYARTDPIQLTFTLKNTGKQPVWVNTRFYLSSKTVPPDDREVYLTMTAPSGKELECTFTYPTGFPKTDYFKLLEPGQEVSAESPRNLRSFFTVEEAGAYRVTATYHNVFGAELGLDAAEGPSTAKPVEFTITP